MTPLLASFDNYGEHSVCDWILFEKSLNLLMLLRKQSVAHRVDKSRVLLPLT
jgi:hypothetical protein